MPSFLQYLNFSVHPSYIGLLLYALLLQNFDCNLLPGWYVYGTPNLTKCSFTNSISDHIITDFLLWFILRNYVARLWLRT